MKFKRGLRHPISIPFEAEVRKDAPTRRILVQPGVRSSEHRPIASVEVQIHHKRYISDTTCQDPNNPRKRIYRVFQCIEDVAGSETETGHALKGSAKVSTNRAIRDSLGTVLTQKAATLRDPMAMHLAIEDGSVAPDVGQPSKKRKTTTPKVLTDEEKQRKEFDANMKKILFLHMTQVICSVPRVSSHALTTSQGSSP